MPVGVVGVGLLGRGIVACLLERGHEVVAVARTMDEHDAALPVIEQMIFELVEHGAAPRELLAQWRLRLNQVTTCESLAPCRFILESVPEDLAVKQSVFDEIERVVSPEAVIASNTSAIPISVLQQARRHPQRFVGIHWAAPAHATRFLELIRGELTSDETIGIGNDATPGWLKVGWTPSSQSCRSRVAPKAKMKPAQPTDEKQKSRSQPLPGNEGISFLSRIHTTIVSEAGP